MSAGKACTNATCPGVHGPAHLDARVDAFLGGYEATLAALEPEALERHRAALIAAKLQKDRGLADEASRHWEQIATRRCALHAGVIWEHHRRQAAHLPCHAAC